MSRFAFDASKYAAAEWEPTPTDMESSGKPRWAHHSCGARWRNRESYGHCCVCHKTFTSDEGPSSAFAKHKTGPMSGTRRCLTTEEMVAAGFTVAPGHLFEGQPTADLWSWRKDEGK